MSLVIAEFDADHLMTFVNLIGETTAEDDAENGIPVNDMYDELADTLGEANGHRINVKLNKDVAKAYVKLFREDDTFAHTIGLFDHQLTRTLAHIEAALESAVPYEEIHHAAH